MNLLTHLFTYLLTYSNTVYILHTINLVNNLNDFCLRAVSITNLTPNAFPKSTAHQGFSAGADIAQPMPTRMSVSRLPSVARIAG